jgi:hypothetical protein
MQPDQCAFHIYLLTIDSRLQASDGLQRHKIRSGLISGNPDQSPERCRLARLRRRLAHDNRDDPIDDRLPGPRYSAERTLYGRNLEMNAHRTLRRDELTLPARNAQFATSVERFLGLEHVGLHCLAAPLLGL